MARAGYTLRLTRDRDGKDVFTRDGISEEQVQGVAAFLEENMGLVLAVKGLMQAGRGVRDALAGLEALEAPPRRRGRR